MCMPFLMPGMADFVGVGLGEVFLQLFVIGKGMGTLMSAGPIAGVVELKVVVAAPAKVGVSTLAVSPYVVGKTLLATLSPGGRFSSFVVTTWASVGWASHVESLVWVRDSQQLVEMLEPSR